MSGDVPLGDFTAAEAVKLAVIEAEPDAPESLRERVAVAMFAANAGPQFSPVMIDLTWKAMTSERKLWRDMADAAIAVLRGVA